MLFGTTTILGKGIVYNENIYRKATFWSRYFGTASIFSKELHFWKKLIVQKSSILYYPLFLESYLFRVATFSKDAIFYSNYLFRRATFSQHRTATFWWNYFLSKLHFQNLYFLRTPTFSEQIHFFSKPTFSEDVVFLNSYFSTANLAFIVTLSIDYLVINPTNTRVFRLKLPRGCTKCWTIQKIFSLNTMNKNFPSNLLSQGSHEQNYLSANVKNFSFWSV